MFQKIKEWKFQKIARDIKSIKIQGARNVAKAALNAYEIIPTEKSKKILLSLRPTEPMLQRVLEMTKFQNPMQIMKHFDEAQNKINLEVFKLISKGDIIFTHCHSTNVVNSLIYSKQKKKDFEVYNSETRPLYQGRKTSKELSENKIKVTQFVDSAIGVALSKEQGTKKVTKVFLGADALLEDGIINKIGSGTIAKLAKLSKIPVFIIADSWKYSKNKILLEQREVSEIWKNAPREIQLKNPAFEFVDKKYITGIVTELGLMKYDNFVKKLNFFN